MRLSPIDTLTTAQADLLEQVAGRRSDPPLSFTMWARNMDAAAWVEGLGDYARSKTPFPHRLRLITMLVAGREFDAISMWNAHHHQAIDLGMDPNSLARLAAREDPAFEREDERVVYAFAHELLRNHIVSDATFAAALQLFGEPALVDLIVCLGYFTMSCMAQNAFQLANRPEFGNPFSDLADDRAAPFLRSAAEA